MTKWRRRSKPWNPGCPECHKQLVKVFKSFSFSGLFPVPESQLQEVEKLRKHTLLPWNHEGVSVLRLQFLLQNTATFTSFQSHPILPKDWQPKWWAHCLFILQKLRTTVETIGKSLTWALSNRMLHFLCKTGELLLSQSCVRWATCSPLSNLLIRSCSLPDQNARRGSVRENCNRENHSQCGLGDFQHALCKRSLLLD